MHHDRGFRFKSSDLFAFFRGQTHRASGRRFLAVGTFTQDFFLEIQGQPPPIIYLVDDDPSFLRALSRRLPAVDYQVETFASAAEFLTRGRLDAAGCAVLDLQMPGPGGLGLQEALAQAEESLPVMGAGLYDAAFAILGQIYRDQARGPITTLTLFGGFSSTICWPLSGLLVESTGWRAACFFYAGLQLVVSLPIYLLLLQKSTGSTASQKSGASEVIGSTKEFSKNRFARFILVAAAITLSAIIQSTMGSSPDYPSSAGRRNLALGTLVGPSQVLARVAELRRGDAADEDRN
jgi:CheY-like chemotaxis protein